MSVQSEILKTMKIHYTIISLLLLGLLPSLLHAQTASLPGADSDALSRKVVNPTASLMTIGFRLNHIEGFYGNEDESATLIQFQPVIPFEFLGVPNILRITATSTLDGPGGSGFNDVALFNLFVIDKPWGRWAFGPVLDIINNPPPGGDNVTAGPAIGTVLSKKKWTYGVFNQNFFGSETALSSIQPVIGYQLGGGYSLSAGDAQFTYDWDSSQWVNLPVGVSLNKVMDVIGQPLKMSINPEYNFRDIEGAGQFTIRFGLSLIF